MPFIPDDESAPDERPSRSARKREAEAAQKLGEALIELRDAELAALDLPEALREAVREAQRIGSRAAGARQRQYIGRLMRDIDPEPIRAALAARASQGAREALRFRHLEEWRARLITEGAPALDALAAEYPGLDRTKWLREIAAAQAERQRSEAGTVAARALWRSLRALADGKAPSP